MTLADPRRHLPALALGLALLSSAPAFAQTCRKLTPADAVERPTGQVASATLGRSTPVKPPTRHVPVPTGPLESVRIGLKRTPCLGTCPSYSVELRGDGTASYDGDAHVLVMGHHTFQVAPAQVECLLSHFKQADFWSLADAYVALKITDGPHYALTLTIEDRSKSVIDYFGPVVGLPPLVPAIENEVDEFAAIDRWVKGDAETLPSLRAEHFDFRSPEAANLLADAATHAPTDVVEGLIRAGAPPTGRRSSVEDSGWWFRPDRNGPTALESASHLGRLSIVKALIAAGALAGASPDAKGQALISAAESGDPRVVAEILATGPDANARNARGDTALIMMGTAACTLGDCRPGGGIAAVARALIAAGCDPNAANRDGVTALHSASDATTVLLLLRAGARIDVRDKDGSTPLLTATTDAAAVALIEAGADVTAKDRFGEDIARRATSHKFTETLCILRARAKKK